jgi:pyruvate dehydrogenase E1 component alpha subunit
MTHDRFFADSPIHVRDRLSEAIERARTKNEPTLVEIRTYRFRGHSMSDPGKYRTPEELEQRKKQDTVLKTRDVLAQKGHEEALGAIDAEIEQVIADALRFAEDSPDPGPELLESTTYAGPFAR